MDKGLDPVAAIEKSWFMTRGHGWRIFGMFLLAIPMFLIGLLLIAVGAYFALMWVSAAFASLYYAVDLQDQARINQNGVAPAEVAAGTGLRGNAERPPPFLRPTALPHGRS